MISWGMICLGICWHWHALLAINLGTVDISVSSIFKYCAQNRFQFNLPHGGIHCAYLASNLRVTATPFSLHYVIATTTRIDHAVQNSQLIVRAYKDAQKRAPAIVVGPNVAVGYRSPANQSCLFCIVFT